MTKQQAFTEVIKKNQGLIFKVSSIYTNNTEDQKDLYQEIVYQLWKSYKTFKGNSKISTWMYRVALNTSITFLKKGKKSGVRVPIEQILTHKTEQEDTILEERITLLHTQIKKLNIIEKGIVLLYLEGKSYDNIAEITGFSKTNIGTRLSRIKEKLKTQILK
ncbi:sigma-70 family RNA polymerase sigma factor [Aureibaculum sp. 2210JD6-5]|uniref:RNA polymerase sigma factor n=1 Tax=Aureibaculum sp. 2210JD6-5 TaxID=3103957 RepID=UPI002AAC90EC|nr:sigma-70 family RNA polymerase sigma factor [Aureibaculum sp. 2210JD6-5]MDY7395020.1 sigma-70 family RNA polymerase sigma factor [Aureibaculum sp. 2210JD6-5]